MNKCLVTKLAAVIDNPNLAYFNTLVIGINSDLLSSGISVKMKTKDGGATNVKVSEGITLISSEEIPSDADTVIRVSGDNGKIFISPKDGVEYSKLHLPRYSSFNINQLRDMNSDIDVVWLVPNGSTDPGTELVGDLCSVLGHLPVTSIRSVNFNNQQKVTGTVESYCEKIFSNSDYDGDFQLRTAASGITFKGSATATLYIRKNNNELIISLKNDYSVIKASYDGSAWNYM